MHSPTNEVHAHEVMAMMMTSDEPFTRESLAETIRQRFGADTRFCSCSASNMTAEDLVTFLEERGKFAPHGAGFSMDPTRVCNH